MKQHPKNISKGFTLIELLVAMAITTIIVSVLVSVTVVALDIWNRSRSEVRASLQGEAMVKSMAADFESLVVRRGNDFQWLYAEYAPPGESPGGDDITASPNAVDLIFFSAATDRYNGQIGEEDVDLGGDVSTIAYQLAYKDPIDSSSEDKFKTFVLYRKIVDPKPTFDNLLGKVELKNAFDTYSSGATNAVDAEENFVCENVYQFTVTFHVDVIDPDDQKTISVPIIIGEDNSGEEFIVTGNGLTSPSSSEIDDAVLASGRLTSVEISLTVLTDFGIRQMQGRNFTEEQLSELSEFIAENSYQYSKLIPVPSY